MITEPTTTSTPAEIFDNIEKVHAEVESLQRELSQAMQVWNSTLDSEKQQFETLLAHKEMAAKEQDGQWTSQSRLYDARLAELKAEFDARLMQAEQNATRALTELDDTWQRDKLEWGPAAQSTWPVQRQELETKVQTLEARIAQLESEQAVQADRPSPETVQSLEHQLLEFQDTVAQLQTRATQSDDLVNACVQALDYQISVLYDLIHHHRDEPQ